MIKKLKEKCRVYYESLLVLLGVLIIFIIGMYRVEEVGQPILFNDEYGYWAGSSYLMGVDWSSVTSRVPYYSYGYGVFLMIIRGIGHLMDWQWQELYQAAVVMHILMLCGSYFIAIKLCKRYFFNMSVPVRYVLCLAAILYPSNLVFTHVTMTESTLTFLFWVFLLILMYATDKPSVGNHIALAVIACFIYAVHQRTLSILIAAVMVVIYMDLRKKNRWIHTVAFGSAFLVALSIHSVLKKGLQNDFYMGNPSAGFWRTFALIGSKQTVVLFALIAAGLVLLLMLRKGKVKSALNLTIVGLTVGIALLMIAGGRAAAGQPENVLIAMNDFSGQIYKIQGLLTWRGWARFGISLVGKLFYFASGTALVILWGIKDQLIHFFWMCLDAIKALRATLTGKDYQQKKVMGENAAEDLWLLGVFVASAGTLLICALYKEGLYKVDDLVHGRYVEFLIGILLLYSFNSLLKDKHWIRNGIIIYILYSMFGILTQYVFNELKRDSFELCHSVMFGRIFWNWQVPVGKVREVAEYVLPIALAIILLVKVKLKFVKENWLSKFNQVRCVVALMIPIVVWTKLSYAIIDNYVVSRNIKQTRSMDRVAFWIDALDEGIPVYYLEDTENYRWAESLQFMLQERVVIMTTTTEADYSEDAFWVMDTNYAKSDVVQEKCQIVLTSGQFTLVANRESKALEVYEEIQSRYE